MYHTSASCGDAVALGHNRIIERFFCGSKIKRSRYEPVASFGVIATNDVVFDVSGRLGIATALETLSVWNLRQGKQVRVQKRCVHTDSDVEC